MNKFFFISWVFASFVIALFLFLLGSVSNKSIYQPAEILPGTGFREIASQLKVAGIIRSGKTFLIYGFLSGAAHQLKPGNYSLSAGSSTPAIILELIRGPKIDKEITFPEGVTVKDMDAMLAAAKILPAGALVNFNKSYEVSLRKIGGNYKFLKGQNSLEGFLFPDTYRFFLNSNTEQV